MIKVLVPMLAVSLLASGCSFNPVGNGEFACPGMPKGVTCKTPREVYNTTNGEKAGVKKSSKNKAPDVPTYVFANTPRTGANLEPIPVIEQAQVMRIWVAPWVDRNKDLHWPGVVFTEIKPRQWHFGEEEFDGGDIPIPHKYVATDAPTGVAGPVAQPVLPKAKVEAAPGELPKPNDEPLN